MSAGDYSHSGQSAPPCTGGCDNVAMSVSVDAEGSPVPRCLDCLNLDVNAGYRSYPLEAFYEPPGPDAMMVFEDQDTVVLCEPDGDGVWLRAHNDKWGANSFQQTDENR